ncbi:MAG TPA: TM0106 family RecB-like putative nuclease [Pyrinomonadaceae bacterium]|nr:TM0106 family RecB-like putative nuclease [Pyrinomonadaceae bacterium]
MEHEQKYLRWLRETRRLRVVEIDTDIPWSEAAAATIDAIAQGVDAIYQATFLQGDSLAPDSARHGRVEHGSSAVQPGTPPARGPTEEAFLNDDSLALDGARGGRDARDPSEEPSLPFVEGPISKGPIWGGRADFLVRVDKSSRLGNFSYEVVEAKLARSTKARAIIQLCFYSDLLSTIQGVEPDYMHVVLGGGAQPEKFSLQRYLAYFRKVRGEFEAADLAKAETYPEPVELCNVCDWFSSCNERWHADDHLSLVAGITRNQRKALVEREIRSVEKLATLTLPVTPKIDRIAPASLLRIREQARVQVLGREKGEPVYELLDPDEARKNPRRQSETENAEKVRQGPLYQSGDRSPHSKEEADEAPRGLAALPLPSPGDLFLDFEGDPFAFDQGLEYLIGTVTIADDGTANYEAIWSFDPKSERHAFVEFINKVKQIRERHPDMHIYHYSPYEPTAIKHLAGRHGVCTDEVDELLRAEVFVDLFRVVRQGLRPSVESYCQEDGAVLRIHAHCSLA